jgi:DNA-directed RNA polymerase specialized sigma24 family protein
MLVSTDTELIRRAAAGDREAFERLLAESLPPVWAFSIRHAAGRSTAEVLTRRILRRAFAEIDRYEGDVPFAAWLLEVARRVAAASGPRAARSPSAPDHTRLA